MPCSTFAALRVTVFRGCGNLHPIVKRGHAKRCILADRNPRLLVALTITSMAGSNGDTGDIVKFLWQQEYLPRTSRSTVEKGSSRSTEPKEA